MADRLFFAAIGAMLGLALGALLWWLYGLGISRNTVPGLSTSFPLRPWALSGSIAGGLGGLILKDRVADVFTTVLRGVFDAERGDNIGLWLPVAAMLAILAALAWVVWKSQTGA